MKGILFKPDSVKAIRERRKTATRRAGAELKEINQEPDRWEYKRTNDDGRVLFWLKSEFASFVFEDPNNVRLVKPRYQVGEILYIKEAWAILAYPNQEGSVISKWYSFFKDGTKIEIFPDELWLHKHKENLFGPWRSPLFMPAWAARDFIKILDRRAERL